MTENPVFDYSKVQDLDKQKQAQNEQLNILLDQNDLVRKKIPDGPNSLLRAVSDALYSTPHYAEEIQQFLFKHLKHLIATDKLPTRLTMFRGNSMLVKDYTSSPHMAGFDKINIELVSSQFKAKIVVYNASEDNYLSSIIVNNHYGRTIELVRTKNNHYEPVYSKLYMQKMGVAQNIILNIIEKALNKDAVVPFKNLNEDSYINFQYLNWLSTLVSDSNLTQFRITRGKHKKSFSDSFGKAFEPTEGSQMKLYNMFTNTKAPDDFLKLLQPRKDTAESNFSINDDFGFMDEPWQETPTNPTKTTTPPPPGITTIQPPPGITSIQPPGITTTQPPLRAIGTVIRGLESPFKTQANKTSLSNTVYFEDNKSEKTPVRDMTGISPVHFINTPPPGITPSKYPQKSFLFTELGYAGNATTPGSNAEVLASSPTFQRPPSSQQIPADMYGQITPTRQGFNNTNFSQAYSGTSPVNQGVGGLYVRRTGEGDALILSVKPTDGMMQGAIDQGVLSASKEKKKPIILDESKDRFSGRLKFFDETKNYGFIIRDGDGLDIFVHMDDLMKANITKDMLRDTKNGVVMRLAFSCMKYIGKYQKSTKATDIELIQ